MTPPIGLTIFVHLLIIGCLRVLRLFGFKVLVPTAPAGIGEWGQIALSFLVMFVIGLFLLLVVTNIVVLAFMDSHATWRLLWKT